MREFFRWRPPLGSLLGIVFFSAASLTPSLLPRPWFVQGAVSGLAMAIGYGLGSALDAVLRPRTDRAALSRIPFPVRLGLAVLGLVVIVAAVVVHWLWQEDVRRIMDLEGSVALYVVGVLVSAMVAGYFFLSISRALRRLVAGYRRLLTRFVPQVVAALLTVVTAIVVTIVGFDVLIADRLFVALDRAYMSATVRFDVDVAPPTSSFRSGGPGSLIAWESMGSQGRAFVAQGPDVNELTQFRDRPGQTPIRVYSGLQSAGTARERAELAVAELERTGAFRRELLVLITPTGTGWIDPYAIDPLEYMYAGDTAAVAIQYSHRPSWLVMVGNQDVAIEASAALFEAVARRLEGFPESARPAVLLYGESLGSFGLEALFEDLDDVRDRSDGVLWVGPPQANRLWSRLVAARQPDSPLWRPVYEDGRTVRFGADGGALMAVDGQWIPPRVAYLQHPSDPITWLSVNVMFRRPKWLQEPRGPDVSAYMPYIPMVTFWQLAVDLVVGTNAPIGHGHKFGPAQAEAWAQILPPDDWTRHDTERLLSVVDPDD